jgi:hypothetical protein
MTDSWDNPVYDAALAYQKTAALTAAIQLDIFTLIGTGATTSEALSEKAAASNRGIRILCDFLTVIGLLKKEQGVYSLAPAAGRYLDRTSPACIASSIDFFAAPEMVQLMLDDPASYVRRGGSDGLRHMAPDHPIWLRFANAMAPIARLTAKRAAAQLTMRPGPLTAVLDVAAGHGLYGIEVARARPEAMVTAVDWPAVLQLASTNAVITGVADRFRTIPGNAFEVDWGAGFDLAIVANFLHHFSPEECATILRKVRSSLSPTGQACAIEYVPNEDRVSPPLHGMFAFCMLATTPGGDAYTPADLDKIAKAAGFAGTSVRPLRPTPQSLVLFETWNGHSSR